MAEPFQREGLYVYQLTTSLSKPDRLINRFSAKVNIDNRSDTGAKEYEIEAVAQLFVSAPDLLSACKAFDMAMCNGSRDELIKAVVAARAAIAKAEGT